MINESEPKASGYNANMFNLHMLGNVEQLALFQSPASLIKQISRFIGSAKSSLWCLKLCSAKLLKK